MRQVTALIVTGIVLIAAAGCGVEEALPAPMCADGGSTLIAAQSVPTATQIPCLERLPDGWLVASVSINQDRTIVRLDSDRAGDNAATLRLQAGCDVSRAVPAPSDLPAADRYDQIDRLDPGLRASRYYVFPGGCIRWTFVFDDGVSATESVAIGEALTLLSRTTYNDGLRETFIDEEI